MGDDLGGSRQAGRSVLDLAAATPPERDRTIDFLRVVSITVVVLGHWLIAVVVWRDGHVEGYNALEVIEGLPFVTWILQVMPIFFFVGGFANLRTWRAVQRDGGGYASFLHGRMVRMLWPTLAFLAVGVTVTVTLDAMNVADNVVFPASTLITRPLWFLGVYLIVVSLTPLMARAHDRLGVGAVVVLVAAASLVDLIRFGFDVSTIGHLNYAAVWLLAHQVGFLYADRRIRPMASRVMAAGGLAAMAALVALGPYPISMVGLATDDFSNMDPPTLAIVALTAWQIGVVTALRDPIGRWLQRVRVWAAVIYLNSVVMTMFLWHLTAMLLGIGILYPLGWPQPDAGTALWWSLRPVWVATLLPLLAGFVAAFGRFERRGARMPKRIVPSGASSAVAATVSAVLLVLGVLGFAVGGMHQLFSTTGVELVVVRLNPAQNLIHLALGAGVLYASVRPGILRRGLVGSGAALTALMLAGVVSAAAPDWNPLAINKAGTIVHGVLAAGCLLAAAVGRRRDAAPMPPAGARAGRDV